VTHAVLVAALDALSRSTSDVGQPPRLPDLSPAGGGTAATISAIVVLGLVVLVTLARAARTYARGRTKVERRPEA
jgi:hypothetical protein